MQQKAKLCNKRRNEEIRKPGEVDIICLLAFPEK
jgi:hypothetical protein